LKKNCANLIEMTLTRIRIDAEYSYTSRIRSFMYTALGVRM
jgi:hypothetical protein